MIFLLAAPWVSIRNPHSKIRFELFDFKPRKHYYRKRHWICNDMINQFTRLYDMIWYDMIWYDMLLYDMKWYYDIMIWYDIMICYDMISYDRQTDRQTHRHTDRHTGRYTDRQTNRLIDYSVTLSLPFLSSSIVLSSILDSTPLNSTLFFLE